jgi:hypothetical protein
MAKIISVFANITVIKSGINPLKLKKTMAKQFKMEEIAHCVKPL